MTAHHDAPEVPLDERVRDAERAVVLQDRRLQQAFDELTQQTRDVARSGGRALLGVAGVGLAGWLAWRLAHRPARRREREREQARRARRAHDDDDRPRSGWHKLFNTALLVAPFVLPAGSRATGAVDALAPGRGWTRRLLRLLRAALAWNGRRAPAPGTAAGVRASAPASRRARPPAPR